MNVIVATYLGIGVVLGAISALVGGIYLTGRAVVWGRGRKWAELSLWDRQDAMFEGVHLLILGGMVLFGLIVCGHAVAVNFGWIGVA